jgi:transposase InsO family protein
MGDYTNHAETLGHSARFRDEEEMGDKSAGYIETLGHSMSCNEEYITKSQETSVMGDKDSNSVDCARTLGLFSTNDNSTNFDRPHAVEQLLRLEHLNPEEIEHVRSILTKHSDRFHLPNEPLGTTNATQHYIPTINEIPIHNKQYRFPPVHKEEIDKQVDELLNNNLVEYSTSPYNSPIWIVPKKPDSQGNKRWRMVIDYRGLNEKTIGDAYPLPNITDILDQLGSAKYFSIFDLASGFHQISMSPKDAHKTAFSTPYGHYQFKRMPFGLKNAPATFQRLMDNVLSGLQGNELFVYMDDIVVYARSLREHEIKCERLMQRLRDANLQLQPDKCEFLRHEVAYLGHIIGANGVKPDPGKIKSIMHFPTPKNPKNIKQFLGLAGYYRRFIPNFSKVAKPLTDLLKKDSIFNWQLKQVEAFNSLKHSLCSNPILQYPDFTRPFILTTDASGYAIGGILSQGPVGKDLPVSYTSRILNTAEQNYSTIEKECLAIIYCINHFRPYLYGRLFTIITDHKPLIWLHSIKDPTSRLWKWKTKLAEYNYEIKYKKGSLNNNADALSRNPPVDLVLPIFASDDDDDSSDESIFSSRPRPSVRSIETSALLPYRGNNIENPNYINITENNSDSDDESSIPNNDNHEYINMSGANSGTEYDYVDSAVSENTPIIQPSLEKPRIPSKVKMREIRDNLLNQKDNHVIFISLDGTPYDRGAELYSTANLLPAYENLNFERVNVKRIKSNNLISIPIRTNHRLSVEPQTVKNCIRSLLDCVNELQLTSFSISKTHKFDDIPWSYIVNQLKRFFYDTRINITICQNLVDNPIPIEREKLILENHASAYGGHKGVTKTFNRLRPHYFWSTMKQDIQEFIKKCRECQLKKLTRVKTKQPMIITDTPGTAFDKVSLDIVGPFPITNNGNKYILTMQDLLTKYSIAVPLKEATSLTIADAFTKEFICIYGTPKAILTDQGTNFLSILIRALTKRFNIQHFKTTAYHPQSNGSIERSHHVLVEYLKTQIDKEDNWDEYIKLAMFSYNTSVHEGTKFSPYELIFGKLARLPSAYQPIEESLEPTYQEYINTLFNKLYDIREEARQNLIRAKERSKYYYDQRINPRQFKIGDYVFLLKEPKKGKFSAHYIGPYEITEILPSNNAKIMIDNKPRIVHIDKLKLAHIDPG